MIRLLFTACIYVLALLGLASVILAFLLAIILLQP